jgi:hypothetical protein
VTGKTFKTYAYKEGQAIGRILSSTINTTWIISTPEGKRKIDENKQILSSVYNSDIQYYTLYPERFVDFEIPWKLNFTHVFSLQTNTNKITTNTDQFTSVQTLSLNGDASVTKRWKISGTSYYDIKTNKITNCNFTLTRNLHC